MTESDKSMAWAAKPVNQERVKYFFQAGAIAIGTEAEATPDHVKRISFAKKILYGEMSTYQLAVAVTTNEAVKTAIVNDTEPTDAEINAATSGLITPFVNAGAAT